MQATARRPLWVRLGAALLASVVFLSNTLYPILSFLPAPPLAVAQESPPSATDSAAATPAASVATPAPSPLDPLDNLDSLLLTSSPSAAIVLPEASPETTPSALPSPSPEASPETQISTPSASPSSSPDLPTPEPAAPAVNGATTHQADQLPHSPTVSPPDPVVPPLPPLLSPFVIRLRYPFVGHYPLSYGFGEHSDNDYVTLMQSLFGVQAHDGLDFALPHGTPVLAADGGEVIVSGNGLYGLSVVLRHAWGNSYYGHLSQTTVQLGDVLEPGQTLGYSGNSGVSTAPHLHFGIRPNHYDPHNGYHGMIDPLPYLKGQLLAPAPAPHALIHLPYKTLKPTDLTLSIPILASESARLTYRLKDPFGNWSQVYPSVSNFGTGQTAVLPRPNPFVPGEYTLTVEDALGHTDTTLFSWGVVTLNTNQSRYELGQTAKLQLAVLDATGEMVCDADLSLTLTTPSGSATRLTTASGTITRNLEVCQSKALTLTPDYAATFVPSEVGTYLLSLTAVTPNHTFTIADTFEVAASLPYTLERLTATRIFPGNLYPVILKLRSHAALNGPLVETVPLNFATTPGSEADLAPWLAATEAALFDPTPYTRTESSVAQTLSWELSLEPEQTVILGYTYDAPDESPALYSLGPISFAGLTEARSYQLAIDATDPILGNFKTSGNTTWTSAGDANLDLAQPDPVSGDLMLAVIAIRPSASTVNTPTGWTSHGSWSGSDGGAEGVDTGSVSLYWFSKTADGTEGTATQTFTETGTTSVWMGNIFKVRSSTGTYSVSAGGYSLNGDVTNWNGTLDTNIGVKTGDLVFIAGAQNGDLSGASAYALAATNVNTQSTMTEIGEFTSQTGNDVEVDIAQNLIWDGNNTTTPTITFTQSVAASGAVSAIRIRQGSGTNRTDTFLRSIGLRHVGTTSVSPAYADHDYGDLLVLTVVSRGTGDPTPTTPTGWTLLGSSYNGGSGAFAADAGASRTTTYYREATSRLTGTVTVTITGGSVAIGQIYSIHRDDLASWTISSDGGTDTTVNTSWSITGSGLSLDSGSGGDVVLVVNSINTDAYSYTSPSLTASGSTFATTRLDSYHNSATGNDMGIWTYSTEVTSGSSSGAPTFTLTANSSAGSAPTGSAMIIKILGNTTTFTDTAVGFFTPPATWTSAGDANLTLTYPDPRNGDLLLAVLAIRPSTSTISTPSGWSLVDNRTGTDGGAEGADTGSVGIYVFSKTSDGTEGTGTLAFTETGTTSVWIGNIMKLRSGTGTYSISGSGYSLSGDTVTWGSTLGADIGLTSGDLVVLAAAQNGDLSNTSAWDVSATGITQKSTFNEHGEFGSTTGNDVEVGLASGLIWDGTNSATPSLTLTQSAAASGVVSAVRIREGSGVQRTDTWVRSAGAQVVSTTTALTVPYPEHEVDDLLVLFVATRGTSDPTVLTPFNWTSLGSYNGGAGTFGVDAGNARTTAFYHRATSRHSGTFVVNITSADVAVAQVLSLHNKDLSSWSVDSDGGTDTSAGTGWSVTGSGVDISSSEGGSIILIGSAVNTDAYTYSSHALSATSTTFGDVTQEATYNTASGSDANFSVTTGRISSGSGTITPTFTMTGSGTAGSAPAGSSLFVSILGTPSTMTVSGTASGNDGGTVKIALGSSAQSQTGTISSGTWNIYGVTRPSVGTVVTVWVDNVADNLETTAVTLYSAAPVTTLALTTNVLTIGSNQDQSVSLTNLNSYDCTEDEDVMHQAASSHLKVEGDACAGSTTNSYSAEGLVVASGDTLAVGGSETVTTYDFTITGTVTSTSTATYNVAHDWAKTGTFTAGSSTVNLTGADSSTQTLSGTTTFYNLAASTTANSAGRTINFTGNTTTTVSNNWTIQGASGKVLTLGSTDTNAWTIAPTAATVDYATVSRSTSNLVICATHSTDGGNNNANWSFTSGTSCSSNTAPNNPSSLAQKTTGDVTLTTGAWHNSTSVKFSATATDTDNPDTLYLCIEADQLGTSFSNTEDSCGSGVAYSGTGVTVTHTLTLTDATEYHWQARIKDAAGEYSSWVSYDVNAESARDVGVDSTAPTGGTVYDGTSTGVDTTFATNSLSSLSANWDSFNTNVSGLARYEYSIGTTAGATDIKAWTDNSTTTSVTATGLTLQTSQLYYFNVRAVDNAGNTQTAVSSNGQLVSPSLSFAISPATTTFSNLSAGNSYTDTKTTTLTTSTNAYNGYVIRAFVTDYLKNVGGTHQIADFSGGTYASPATWSGSETGFGYTSSDTTIQGSNKFGGATLYAPFSQTGPGDIVADHTSTVTGTSISNESFDITYKVKVPSTQAATLYTTTVVYTATAQY